MQQVTDPFDPSKVKFIDVNGIRTRYYEDGDGEPIFLFSGGQFASLYSLDAWSLNVPGLAEHFRVFSVDKLAQGHTDNPPSDAGYTFEALMEHTYGLVRALGVTQGHFVGHSRGGLLVTRLALDYPGLVKTLVLVDSATTAPESPIFPTGAFYRNLQPTWPPTRESVRVEPDAQAFSRAQITDSFVDRLLEIAKLPKSKEAHDRMEAIGSTISLPSIDRARKQTIQDIETHGLPVPTLLIWGLNDRSAPLPLGLQLFERIALTTPQSEMHVLNGAGHYSYREQPEAFNRAVRSFCLA